MMGWYISMRKILIIQPRPKLGRELYMLAVVGTNIISMDEENDGFVLCSFFFTELFIGSGGEWH